jgi:hypothetical protein
MIQSIFCDFFLPSHQGSRGELMEQVVIDRFLDDLIDLSKDKVPNVRIQLSEAFYHLYKQYEKIDIELADRKLEEDKREELQ